MEAAVAFHDHESCRHRSLLRKGVKDTAISFVGHLHFDNPRPNHLEVWKIVESLMGVDPQKATRRSERSSDLRMTKLKNGRHASPI